MQLSRYLKLFPAPDNKDAYLIYSTLRSSIALISKAALMAAEAGCGDAPETATLQRLGMLVADRDQERDQMRSMLERVNGKSRRFTALVVLNLDCNLDCGYCYEGEFRDGRYMRPETAQLLVDKLVGERISAGMDVTVTFYGGEPLLSEELIASISRPLLEAALSHGVNYDFSLITNGTLLTRETAQRLIPLGLKGAKFTLDGPRELHDRQRPFASGSGSFDTIVENLLAVWDLLRIQLGGNFYRESYREFPRLLDQLVERGVTPEKIWQVLFTPVTAKAGCLDNSSGCSCSSEPWLVEALPFLREAILDRGFATTRLRSTACMVELADNVVVNCEGELYKCPAFMGWDGFLIGTLAQGVSDYSASHGIGNWRNDECLDCPYLPLCFGGCRFLSLLQGKGATELDCRREFLDATLERLVLMNLSRAGKTPPAAAA